MIATGKVRDIDIEIAKMKETLRHTSKKEEKLAINNYILNLLRAKEEITGRDMTREKNGLFNRKNRYQLFSNVLSEHETNLVKDYIEHRPFHKGIIKEILNEVENEIDDIYQIEEIKEEKLSENDFREIFIDFLKKYKLDGLFEELISKKKIFRTGEKEENYSGFSLFNPMTNDGRVFIFRLMYNMSSMFTLAHELGHIYDYKTINEEQKDKNIYMYETFYGEVVSKLFERLFISYLIKNNILGEKATEQLTKMMINNYDFILTSYILNLLDEELYYTGKYHFLSGEEVFEMVKDKFESESEIYNFLKDFIYFDLSENFTYVYGDIISMFLQDVVEEDGFNNELFKKFQKERFELFNEKFYEDNNINAKEYIKRYRRDINLIKK